MADALTMDRPHDSPEVKGHILVVNGFRTIEKAFQAIPAEEVDILFLEKRAVKGIGRR